MLFNDSFASTNEREGSEIARQIVRALIESGVRVCYVTHLYDLAHGLAAGAAATTPCSCAPSACPTGSGRSA